ncbi:hypothetical protein L484_024739 [Morus notabilis]|uniref:DRBM domain-containing protein n=2 Tax=Morus notabilis TaxID=981085 RepID=W9RTA8_9ROSA|nr:hypothetical protein L484_024739 [Morus notabilis]
MDLSDVCPTEDAVQALLEYLVDPMLPTKSSVPGIASQSQLQAVAKQVHAVLLLYNYYHRKQNPALEYLGFNSFCKLAVILKPALLGHLKFMQISNDKELDDPENQLSVMEKTIMHACDISKVLDASRENPNVEGWPITKVAVFLVDSKKEKCFLLFSSVTQGVWSVIGNVEVLHQISDSTAEATQANKKRGVIRKPSRVISKVDVAGFLQLAYSAVKDVTGVTQTDLMVLEDHLVYSTSKEKEAARFYIMQCTKSVNDDICQVPTKDAIDSLQGPLLEKSSGRWTVTPVVEYFHLLPYAGILAEWMHRKRHSNNLQHSMLGESPERKRRPSDSAIYKMQDTSDVNSGLGEGCGNKMSAGNLKSAKEKDMIGISNTVIAPQTSEITKQYSDISHTTQVENDQKMITSNSTGSDLNGQASGVSVKELDALCHANDWILPTYHVRPTEGGFKANVTIKGADFDYSSEGDLHSNPREARESAAALILRKLQSRACRLI